MQTRCVSLIELVRMLEDVRSTLKLSKWGAGRRGFEALVSETTGI
jgi:hypothetical protein